MIQIIQIDIDNYIDNLWANGDRGDDIIVTLYDCRINGIDSIPKAETAYGEWARKRKGVLVF
jgi:hypothetical protein